MPRYYFPSSDGREFVPDEFGLELDGLEDARALAARALAEMASESLPACRDGRVFRIRVLSPGDCVLLEMTLTFALTRAPGGEISRR